MFPFIDYLVRHSKCLLPCRIFEGLPAQSHPDSDFKYHQFLFKCHSTSSHTHTKAKCLTHTSIHMDKETPGRSKVKEGSNKRQNKDIRGLKMDAYHDIYVEMSMQHHADL